MDPIYFFLLILIIIAIIGFLSHYWSSLNSLSKKEIDSLIQRVNYDSSHVIEGFSRRFFQQVIPTYFVGLDYEQLFGNDFTLLHLISQMIPYNIDTLLVRNSTEIYQLLNSDKLQFIIARSHTLHNIIYQTMPGLANLDIRNVRFVCALYMVPINILTYHLDINEFGKLKGSGLTVNIGSKYSGDYFAALDLFMAYDLEVGKDIFLTYYEGMEIVDHYGCDIDVLVYTCSHPDITFGRLVDKKLSRFVEIKKYNDGDIYHISPDEQIFYKEHPFYLKMILIKEDLKKYYKDIMLADRQFDPYIEQPLVVSDSLFVNVIAIRYYLLSNKKTDPLRIGQLLYNMKLNLDEINKFDFISDKMGSANFSDFTLPMEVHEGARDFFQKSGLYTNIANRNCVYIDGKCDYEQLYTHHMIDEFGKTFDEIYNSESTLNPNVPVFGSPESIVSKDFTKNISQQVKEGELPPEYFSAEKQSKTKPKSKPELKSKYPVRHILS